MWDQFTVNTPRWPSSCTSNAMVSEAKGFRKSMKAAMHVDKRGRSYPINAELGVLIDTSTMDVLPSKRSCMNLQITVQ